MLSRKTSNSKEFNNANLHDKVLALNKTLKANNGKDLDITNKVLDELYQVILFCLEHENKAALLEATESLKLAYGMSWYGSKQIREDEYLYWREVVFVALAKREFQAVEYLIESSKNLLKIFEKKRDVIVEMLKMIADVAIQGKKFFIASSIIDILLYRLHRFERENKKTASAIIGCFASIGSSALKGHDIAFFKEICSLLCQNITKVSEYEEFYWDKMMVNWFNLSLKERLEQSYEDWTKLFYHYRTLRVGANKSFYADLVSVMSRHILDFDNRVVRNFFADILKYTWLKTNYMECIVCAHAFSKAFKSVTSVGGWEKAIFIFNPFFFFCFHLSNRYDKKDKWAALGQTIFEIYLDGVSQAAALIIIRVGHVGPLQVLYKWRAFFLAKSKSKASAERIKKFWLRCAEYWAANIKDEMVKNNEELLLRFQE